MRKKIVAGNWKMNNNLDEGLKLTSEICNMVADELNDDVQVILAPPFIHLAAVGKIAQDNDKIAVAAQNCSEYDKGAYTGEISAGMIKSVKAAYVILGHSERREQFKETEAQLAAKVDKVLAEGLLPIFCCGESLDIRESGKHEAYVCEQITKSLYHLSEADFSKIIIAYEPIWAIGTGKTASPEQAQEMHAAIRKHIAKQYGNNIAENTSVLYGGSCKPDNAKTIFSQPDVDGGLIGGASLKSRDFMDIIKSF